MKKNILLVPTGSFNGLLGAAAQEQVPQKSRQDGSRNQRPGPLNA
jgi:hypothetical protein